MDRRDLLKTLGVAGASALSVKTAEAKLIAHPGELKGVLVDTTRCAGCRYCELMCAETNGLPEPDTDDESVLDEVRTTSETQWTVVNRYDTDVGEVFRKEQCMHCSQPACASACLTRAMLKTEEGPVIWREDKCMGCRFCMVSCPFDAPKFEYDSANPKIQKCNLCWERMQEGQLPACVENCPADALTFGTRQELMDEGRRRIYENPDDYIHAIYGEHDAGGTAWLYLSAVPFEQLGLRTDLGTTAYPEFTKDFLYGVPIVLALWPAFLLALSRSTRRDRESEVDDE